MTSLQNKKDRVFLNILPKELYEQICSYSDVDGLQSLKNIRNFNFKDIFIIKYNVIKPFVFDYGIIYRESDWKELYLDVISQKEIDLIDIYYNKIKKYYDKNGNLKFKLHSNYRLKSRIKFKHVSILVYIMLMENLSNVDCWELLEKCKYKLETGKFDKDISCKILSMEYDYIPPDYFKSFLLSCGREVRNKLDIEKTTRYLFKLYKENVDISIIFKEWRICSYDNVIINCSFSVYNKDKNFAQYLFDPIYKNLTKLDLSIGLINPINRSIKQPEFARFFIEMTEKSVKIHNRIIDSAISAGCSN